MVLSSQLCTVYARNQGTVLDQFCSLLKIWRWFLRSVEIDMMVTLNLRTCK